MSLQNIFTNTLADYNREKLFGREKLLRLASADYFDALKILLEYGYLSEFSLAKDYDICRLVTTQIRLLIEFIEENAANINLKRLLLNRFYYTDAKVLYKAQFTPMLLRGALFRRDSKKQEAIEQKKYNNLSVTMQEALKELDSEVSPLPKTIDLTLTRAKFKENLALAEKISKKMLAYTKCEIDIANLLSLYTAKKQNLSIEEYNEEFIDGGLLLFNSLDFENLRCTDFEECIPFLKNDDLKLFRKKANSMLLDILNSTADNFASFDPFIRYFFAQLAEFKAVRFILVHLKNRIPFDKNEALWGIAV
ncbi:MAG: V-type ATPase subunit [Firmicutes bacterium]|nr:V-type ATPase subunit [Bacillota bacterium]